MAASEQLYAEFLLQELTSVIITPSSSETKSSTAEICVPDQQFLSVPGRHLHFRRSKLLLNHKGKKGKLKRE